MALYPLDIFPGIANRATLPWHLTLPGALA
jgi:hypothetical protein